MLCIKGEYKVTSMTVNKKITGEVIVVVNQKGGVSKTTTALSLWTGLSLLKGFKTLAIDLDPQV